MSGNKGLLPHASMTFLKCMPGLERLCLKLHVRVSRLGNVSTIRGPGPVSYTHLTLPTICSV
eukprot:967674-Alexandrium_andersonii.AAC.1